MNNALRLLGFLWIAGLLGCGTPQESPDKQSSETHVVEIKQMKFSPDTIRVSPGDSIRWVNKGMVTHNVAEKETKQWKSGNLKPDDSFTIEVSEGSSYFCPLHPVMKGRIIINK